ncbi:MAG: type II secretion system F family protein [Pseudomonadota bacterium]
MNIMQMALLALLFVLVFGGALLILRLMTPSHVQRRLDELVGIPEHAHEHGPSPWVEKIVKLAGPLARLSVPEDNWEGSLLRTRFMNAGFRHASAAIVFFSAKTALALCLPLLMFLVFAGNAGPSSNFTLFWLLLAATAGYYLPNIVLKQLIKRRQREIVEAFPDALDLMTICVEAGLAIDAALARIAGEIGMSSQVLAEELNLVTLELRAGGAKDKALRNLALRTGVSDVDALVAMLIQAERFGTSIADSLRIQSEVLRTKRRLRAEETAAQMGLKLLFPLIFFIFPALMTVLLGPAIIQVYRVLLPQMGGH